MDRASLSNSELITAYLRHYRTNADSDFWAWEEVKERVLWGTDAHAAWHLVQSLVSAADETSLGYVAAGPLEDLVTAHGVVLINELEAAARQDPKFRECLGHIWLSEGELPPEILARVVRASGGRIKPLPAR